MATFDEPQDREYMKHLRYMRESEWIAQDDIAVCLICGEPAPIEHGVAMVNEKTKKFEGLKIIYALTNYCPWCGAMMTNGGK